MSQPLQNIESKKAETDSSLSVKICPGTSGDDLISVKLFAAEEPVFRKTTDQTFLTSLDQQNRPKTMNISVSESGLLRQSIRQSNIAHVPKFRVNKIVPSGPWFTVPERVRYVINADPYSVAKAPNFLKDHELQLPLPPKRPKIKASLFIAGQSPGLHTTKSSAKGGLSWVAHVLRPTLKLKQDQFCVNYAEFLNYDLTRKQGNLPAMSSGKDFTAGDRPRSSKGFSPFNGMSK
jgi:hypothetical protein